jgi:hypothetical protein
MSPNNKDDNAVVEDSYLVPQSSKVLTCRCAEDTSIINVLLSNVSLIKSQPFASPNSSIRLIIQGTL